MAKSASEYADIRCGCALAGVKLMAVHHCCSGEMLMGDGSIVPCAIKRVAYSTPGEQELGQLELAALHAALGLPNLVQCLAAFRLKPSTGLASLVIVTRCAPLPLMLSDAGLPQRCMSSADSC